MNQAIQFPEREEWDKTCNAVCFPVLINGMLFTCAISGETLARRFGGATPDEWLSIFLKHRWDLEEEAGQAIDEERINDQGWLWLS